MSNKSEKAFQFFLLKNAKNKTNKIEVEYEQDQSYSITTTPYLNHLGLIFRSLFTKKCNWVLILALLQFSSSSFSQFSSMTLCLLHILKYQDKF